jgi:F-type H+-transporting ATPase subunit gamma
MPSLKDIRTRIKSVTSTQKITRAMKMVAAARLRRAQESVESLRPYAYRLRETLWEISNEGGESENPLLVPREEKRTRLLLMTSDRGLCGGFNTNVNRATENFLKVHGETHERLELAIVGRKGQDYFKRRDVAIAATYSDVLAKPSMEKSRSIAEDTIRAYLAEEIDAVYIVYNEFKNAVAQEIRVERLLPVIAEEVADTSEPGIEFVYEPGKKELQDTIAPLHVAVQIHRTILESIASEMGARMTAMDGATKNAGELNDRLKLLYNRARQASITKELMEIVSGSEALKG